MKKKAKPKPKSRNRERELAVYLWMLQHSCEKTAVTTPMREWSAEPTV